MGSYMIYALNRPILSHDFVESYGMIENRNRRGVHDNAGVKLGL